MSLKKFTKKYIFIVLFSLMDLSAFADKKMDVLSSAESIPRLYFNDGSNNIDIKRFKGNYLLLNFWATWCAPCVTEMPSLNRLAKHFYEKNLLVIAVSQDLKPVSEIESFLEPMMLDKILIWYDEKNKGFRELGLRGLPTTILIGPNGLLLAKLEGATEWDKDLILTQIREIIDKDSR